MSILIRFFRYESSGCFLCHPFARYLSDIKMVNLRIRYLSGGIINIYQDYFNDKLDCTLNDISLEVAKSLSMEAPESFEN